MNPLEQFRVAVFALEKTEDSIIATSARTDASWKREFIELRRQFQVQLLAVAAAVRECQKSSRDKQLWDEISGQLAKLRLNTALRQTVAIDRQNRAYLDTLRRVREANAAFMTSAKKALDFN